MPIFRQIAHRLFQGIPSDLPATTSDPPSRLTTYGRYKSILVEKESYLSELSRYIHLNPVRTRELESEDAKVRWHYLLDYPWSTLPGYLNVKDRWPGVDYGLVLGEFGGDNPKGRRGYGKRIREDLVGGIELKGKIVGGCVLGRAGYIQ